MSQNDVEKIKKKIIEMSKYSSTIEKNLELSDLFDNIYIKSMDKIGLDYCPPYSIRKIVQGEGSLWSYGYVGSEYAAFLKIFCNLKPYHKILEVGCGCGRVSSVFKHYLSKDGAFYGFDAVKELIDYAKQIIPSSNFNFTHINIFNELYNPNENALRSESLKFPYENTFFDIVYLVSVFTHMIPPSITNYTKEISRVLKPKSRCLISMFLLQNNPKYLNGKWKEKHNINSLSILKNNKDNEFFRVGNPKLPEDWVIYDFDYIVKTFSKFGLKLVHGPIFGNWSGNPEWLTHQDLLIFEKE